MDCLSNWTKNRIKGADKKYQTFFNEAGLK